MLFLTFAAAGIFCAALAQAETVRGEGRYMEQKLTTLTPFNAVDVRGDAQVDIWQSGEQRVTVNGKQNLVALADIRVENNTLIVDFKRPVHIKGPHALHVTINLPELTALSVRADGRARIRGAFDAFTLMLMAGDNAQIDGDSIKADVLRVQAMNKADVDLERLHAKDLEAAAFNKASIELSGYVEKGRLTNNSSKDIEADSLRINQAQVAVNGRGDIELFATHTLTANANGKGKIVYHGQPTLTRSGNTKKIQPAFDD